MNKQAREWVSVGITWVQDFIYVALGILLTLACAALLFHGGVDLLGALGRDLDLQIIVQLLDRILLAMMIVELLYTVKVSFRDHLLVPEPFLLVALIAAIRRILVITAEFGAQSPTSDEKFRHVMSELGLLTVLILVLVGSVVILRRRDSAEAPR
ncbi:conserved hypothetical protein [Anaeromyxobacter dehalogenans 2CP-1]|uniref:Phosphate-starvation-inducible E n=1 Tax=Anaeromyxobacter dehalogenans (strain ATCC BAA-258 / DSM 21875 / 2CP-1) TaxID=455488 RepID=B8J9H5_ANAD2|nr:phosphate-starvation-inducible PsiE family protein [Anaeromyxobacter dehalogenans]ACL67363.1 conserved hypothetical protein [Anaeromyxobacter dehalogenans 2CP-1]